MALSIQELFSASDDAAEVLLSGAGEPLEVDASESCFGQLVELLMLKRGAPDRLTIRDRSQRGALFRQLLAGTDPFCCVDGLGLYHAEPGSAETADEATDFAEHAQAALQSAGLQRSAAIRLSGVLHELLGNVDEHAGGHATCLSGYSVQPGEAWLSVADTGDGVLAGYKSVPAGTRPMHAREALRWAVLEHRSRTGLPGRGTGFQTVANALRSLDASLRVRSDEGSIELSQSGSEAQAVVREQAHLRGFVVSINLRWALP